MSGEQAIVPSLAGAGQHGAAAVGSTVTSFAASDGLERRFVSARSWIQTAVAWLGLLTLSGLLPTGADNSSKSRCRRCRGKGASSSFVHANRGLLRECQKQQSFTAAVVVCACAWTVSQVANQPTLAVVTFLLFQTQESWSLLVLVLAMAYFMLSRMQRQHERREQDLGAHAARLQLQLDDGLRQLQTLRLQRVQALLARSGIQPESGENGKTAVVEPGCSSSKWGFAGAGPGSDPSGKLGLRLPVTEKNTPREWKCDAGGINGLQSGAILPAQYPNSALRSQGWNLNAQHQQLQSVDSDYRQLRAIPSPRHDRCEPSGGREGADDWKLFGAGSVQASSGDTQSNGKRGSGSGVSSDVRPPALGVEHWPHRPMLVCFSARVGNLRRTDGKADISLPVNSTDSVPFETELFKVRDNARVIDVTRLHAVQGHCLIRAAHVPTAPSKYFDGKKRKMAFVVQGRVPHVACS